MAVRLKHGGGQNMTSSLAARPKVRAVNTLGTGRQVADVLRRSPEFRSLQIPGQRAAADRMPSRRQLGPPQP